jgi:hypothetical protein
MKKVIYSLRILITLLLLLLAVTEIHAQSNILYSQNFDNAGSMPSGWTASGGSTPYTISNSSPSSSYTGSSGNYNANNGTSGSATIVFNSSLSTVGYTNITVIWGARMTSTGVSPTFYWSADGSTWNSVSYTDVSANSTRALVNGGIAITLPTGAAGVSNLAFKWLSNSSAGTYRIDDFTVKGDVVAGYSSGWLTTGNNGINSSTDFLGTLGMSDVIIKSNNQKQASFEYGTSTKQSQVRIYNSAGNPFVTFNGTHSRVGKGLS